MEREQFITQQAAAADAKLELTSGEEDARKRFIQLAVDTFDFLVSMGADYVLLFDPWPELAGNALCSPTWGRRTQGPPIKLSAALIERWENWNREYFKISRAEILVSR